jgi:hypothetical protein
VTQPRLDCHQVRARLEEFHREAMSKQVRRNPRPSQVGRACRGTSNDTTNHMGRPKPREPATTGSDEDRPSLIVTEAALLVQTFQCSREIGRQRQHALLPAFGEHDQLHPIPPVHVTPSGPRTRTIRYSDESSNSSRTATAGEAIASIFTTTQAGCGRSLPVGPTWSRRIRLWSWPPGDLRFVWPICSRSRT